MQSVSEGASVGTGVPTLILAGPGSGKTYKLSARVAQLLNDGVPKDAITVLAFGRDAAMSMRHKLTDPESDFTLPFTSLPKISTMHALGFDIVKQKPRGFGLRKDGLEVQNEESVKQLLFRDAALLSGFSAEEGDEARLEKARHMSRIDGESTATIICRRYWSIMSQCNKIDFDDQVLFACVILERHADKLAQYQERCHYLLVDEYQDINAAQHRMIELLSKDNRSGLLVVGDDAQSIYGFRGASPKFILEFDSAYPGGLKEPLAHSWRCPKCIIEPASSVLSDHYPEWTGPFSLEYHCPDTAGPQVWQVASEKAEAEWVARLANDAIGERKTVLVLAPKKEFFLRISEALAKWGIAHECPANVLPQNTQSRMERIRSLIDWVRNPADNLRTRIALETLLNHGPHKVPGSRRSSRTSPGTIQRRVAAETEVASLWESMDRKKSLYEVLNEQTEGDILLKLRDSLAELLDAYSEFSGDNCGRFAEVISVLSGAWIDPLHMADDLCSAMDHLTPTAISGPGFVQLMTMRKAKGLEADTVIIVGVEDDLIPGKVTDVTEQARLMYVSMTRAREHLFLMHAFQRPRNISYGQELRNKRRSRFLESLHIDSEYRKL